jgi:hypothetical protein
VSFAEEKKFGAKEVGSPSSLTKQDKHLKENCMTLRKQPLIGGKKALTCTGVDRRCGQGSGFA